MKKGKKAAMVSSYSAPVYPVDEETKTRFRHQSLLQDYQELIKETEAKKEKLEKAKQKRLKLHAEVKFLRRRYTSFLKSPSGITSYRLKRMPETTTSMLVESSQPSNSLIQREVSVADCNLIGKDTSVSRALTGIDLNQVSLPNEEEIQEFQVHWEPLKIDKLKTHSNEVEAMSNNLRLSVCRDTGNGSTRVGKRKITWQDQVALKSVDSFVM